MNPSSTVPSDARMALYELARQRRLPPHQAMDRPTLAWIAAHRPAFAPDVRPDLNIAAILVPPAAWFAEPRTAAGIHGRLHNARVAVLVGILAELHGLDSAAAAALRAAAAVHDCRRIDDREDPGHGRRAETWLRDNLDLVANHLNLDLDTPHLQRACTAVALHDTAYASFTEVDHMAYRTASQETDLLKAADCADRYRLPAMRWWPDFTRTRATVPTWLRAFAYDMVLATEQDVLNGAEPEIAMTTHLRLTGGTAGE